MKTLLLIASLFSFSAFSAEFKVLDVPAGYAAVINSESFGTNADLGRAWVEITSVRNYGEGEESEVSRVKLKGLSFDAATETVNIESEGQIVECAHFVERGRFIFRQKILEFTNRCRFEERIETITVDDGFEITKQKRFRIFLVVL